MEFAKFVAAGLFAFTVVAPAIASEANPRNDIIRAITLLPTVEDCQVRAEANLLIDHAQQHLKEGSRYHAYHLIQRALKLINNNQTK